MAFCRKYTMRKVVLIIKHDVVVCLVCLLFSVNCLMLTYFTALPSVLWHCWLGGRKGIRPVKKLSGGCWRGYLSGTRCRLAHGPAEATVSCFSKVQTGFTFLVLAQRGSPGKRAVKWVCVCTYNTDFKSSTLGNCFVSNRCTCDGLQGSCSFKWCHEKNGIVILCHYLKSSCPDCFDTIGWASRRATGLQKLSDEVLLLLFVWCEVQIVCIWSGWCHCHPNTSSFLASFKSRLCAM